MTVTRHLAARLLPLLLVTLAWQPTPAAAQPGAPTLPTTVVMVNLTVKPDVDRALLTKVMPSEIRDTVQAYLDGKIQQWFGRGRRPRRDVPHERLVGGGRQGIDGCAAAGQGRARELRVHAARTFGPDAAAAGAARFAGRERPAVTKPRAETPVEALAVSDLGCACASARRLARTLTQLYDWRLRQVDVAAPQFAILATLEYGPSSQVALGQRHALDKTTVSRNVQGLKRKGWVTLSDPTTAAQRQAALTRGRPGAPHQARAASGSRRRPNCARP